ncbi:MAG: hypothetical protein H0W64_10110 [Gammaproteobacteria bacterium]|nr:hypothetical protein [Gammaproteobacteria bacterium]
MKAKVFLIIFTMIFVHAGHAFTPKKCPGHLALHAAHLNISRGGDKWFAQDYNYFDTQNKWFFYLSPFDAKDARDAHDKAYFYLTQSNLLPAQISPVYEAERHRWVCYYEGIFGNKAGAIIDNVHIQ